MKTFDNNPKLKEELLFKLKHHEELDTFVQGSWLQNEKVEGNGFKGCFYGCTMQTDKEPREKFSEKYSIDLWYCYLTEKIFEGLPDGEYQGFPYKSIEIVPVGIDFNRIKSRFFQELLKDQLRFCKRNEEVTKAINQCISLFDVPFDQIDESAAWSARSAARSAESAAWSAARSAASAARSAARSAESAAWSAARSAASAAWSAASAAESAASAAGKNHYVWMRDTLFSVIKECTK